MTRAATLGLGLAWLLATATAAGQTTATPANLAQEPVLIESLATTVRFENDGKMRREESASMRVQTPPGVQRAGELVFGYNSANERLHVVSVRVKTADGREIQVGADAVRDLPLPIERIAPVYSDYHQVHVTVPGVSVGAEVSYDVVTERFAPLDPGQFWFEFQFSHSAATRSETLTIDIPQGRAVILRTQPGYAATSVMSRAGRTVYFWHPPAPTSDAAPQTRVGGELPPPPDVQLTTFSSWAAVGAWYAGLQKSQLRVTPALAALAARLTAGQTSERGKAEALYDYVAKTIRYVSLSFGIGRYQPHAAEQVLANEYGDCKDQETLLAALLHAVGIPAEAALVSTKHAVDPDVPSPGQFDHIITAIPTPQGEQWLDTTTRVAAFGMLFAPIRDEEALVIPGSGAAHLERTPADPPSPMFERMTIAANADASGKLEADVKLAESGDGALVLRMLYNAIPSARWPLMDQAMIAATWQSGEVSQTDAKNLALTSAPLQLAFHSTADDFWSPGDKTSDLSLPKGLALPEADEGKPLKVGSPMTSEHVLTLRLPVGYEATAPVAVNLRRPYAQYTSQYAVTGTAATGETVTITRTMKFSEREIPAAAHDDYEAFRRAVQADLNQALPVTRTGEVAAAPASNTGAGLYAAGETAFQEGDYGRAIQLFTQAAAAAAPPADVWNELGRAYLDDNQPGPALAAFQKQIAHNPFDPYAYNNAGLAQMRLGQMQDAAQEFEQQIQINPLDRYAHANLGELLARLGQYAKAIPELQEAAKITPDDAQVHADLGMSLEQTGQTEPAIAELEKAASLAPSPELSGSIGAWMAWHHLDPERAQQYAGQGANAAAQALAAAAAAPLQARDLTLTRTLVMEWEAIGRARLQLGDTEGAIPYLRASWELMEQKETGRALGEAEAKLGHKREAAAIYAQIVAQEAPMGRIDPAALAKVKVPKSAAGILASRTDQFHADQQVLEGLIGAEAVSGAESRHRMDLQNLRTLNFPAPPKADGSAELLLRLDAGADGQGPLRIGAAQWVTGDASLRPALAHVEGAALKLAGLPGGGHAPLIAQGLLSCESVPLLHAKPTCSLVLVPMGDTRMLSFPAAGAEAAGGAAQVQSQQR
ncbi:MAG TPA: DUF3857 domain-containing protein [Terriglobales bacterium]|nr:DUF3857 domain-containing protein [Terriglobales bacterium]